MDCNRQAKDIMVDKLVTLSSEAHVFDGIRLLLKRRITGAPVVAEGNRYLGVFSEKCCMGVLALIARQAAERGGPVTVPMARDFMATSLITVSPQTDVLDAIGFLLKHSISGAPVVDAERKFLGTFSEKSSMRVLLDAAYEQVPSTEVSAFADPNLDRVISEETDLLECVQLFLETPFRRLPVLREGKLVGQVSRRDVLTHAQQYLGQVQDGEQVVLHNSHELNRSDGALQEAAVCAASMEVTSFMDTHARTITENVDLLSIAQLFLNTPYRRLPVLNGESIVGQVSRRDLLKAMHRSLQLAPRREKSLLYLSSVRDRSESPID